MSRNPLPLFCVLVFCFFFVDTTVVAETAPNHMKSYNNPQSSMATPDMATIIPTIAVTEKIQKVLCTDQAKNKQAILTAINTCMVSSNEDEKKIVLRFSKCLSDTTQYKNSENLVNQIVYEQLQNMFEGNGNIILVHADSEEGSKYYSNDYKVIEMGGLYYFVTPSVDANDQGKSQKFINYEYVKEKDSQQIVALLPREFHLRFTLKYCPYDGSSKDTLTGIALMKFVKGVNHYSDLEWDGFVYILVGYPNRPISVLVDSEIEPPVPPLPPVLPQEFIMDVILCDEKGKPLTNPDDTYQLLSKFQHKAMNYVAFSSGQKFKLLLENKSKQDVIATVVIDGMNFYAFNESKDLAKDGIYLDLKAGKQRIVEGWLITTSMSKVFEIKPYVSEAGATDEKADIFHGRIDAAFSSAMTSEQIKAQPAEARGSLESVKVAKPDENSTKTETNYDSQPMFNPTLIQGVSLCYCDTAQAEEIRAGKSQ